MLKKRKFFYTEYLVTFILLTYLVSRDWDSNNLLETPVYGNRYL